MAGIHPCNTDAGWSEDTKAATRGNNEGICQARQRRSLSFIMYDPSECSHCRIHWCPVMGQLMELTFLTPREVKVPQTDLRQNVKDT